MNPRYFRFVICDQLEAVERTVAAAETDLQPRYLERFPPTVAEAERGQFDQKVGGLSRNPESMTAAFRFEHPKIDPLEWVAAQINNGVNVALYSIDPNSCRAGFVRRHQASDDVRFGDRSLYDARRNGDAVIIFSRSELYHATELYQWLVRHFGFVSEQFAWVPDFFYSQAAAEADAEIAAEHAWVLRGRGEGDGYPQYFKVMTRYLSEDQFRQIYDDGEQMSYRDNVAVHHIMSWGLPAEELEAFGQAELESAIYRLEKDPGCAPLYRSILENAVREGLLERFDEEQRSLIASTLAINGGDDDVDYFARLAGKNEQQSGESGSDCKPSDDGKGTDRAELV
jgi:hypothetical protein